MGFHLDSNSQSESSLKSVKVHSLTLSYTHTLLHSLQRTWDVTPGLPSWHAPLQALALVASPRLGLWHVCVVIIFVYLNFFVYVFDFFCYGRCVCVFGAYLFLVVILWKLWAPIFMCLISFFGVCVSYFGVIMEAMNFNYFLMVYVLHIFGYLL